MDKMMAILLQPRQWQI